MWAGERTDGITVRTALSGVVQQRIALESGLVWSLLAMGSEVWVGTEAGPIVVFGANSCEKLREQRQHCGGVHCLSNDGLGGAGGLDGGAAAFSGSNDFTCQRLSDGTLTVYAGLR